MRRRGMVQKRGGWQGAATGRREEWCASRGTAGVPLGAPGNDIRWNGGGVGQGCCDRRNWPEQRAEQVHRKNRRPCHVAWQRQQSSQVRGCVTAARRPSSGMPAHPSLRCKHALPVAASWRQQEAQPEGLVAHRRRRGQPGHAGGALRPARSGGRPSRRGRRAGRSGPASGLVRRRGRSTSPAPRRSCGCRQGSRSRQW